MSNNSIFDPQAIQIGILGGGQLGRMIIQEAISYHFNIHVLDQKNAPCENIATSFSVGQITDYETVLQFGQDKDIITVEIENVNVEALEELEKMGKKVFPQPRVLKIIKDKGNQKQFFKDYQLPTAPFILCRDKNEVQHHKNMLPVVNKLRTGGYDGKGVVILKEESDLDKAFEAPSLIENFVPFEKELAVIVARNEAGETSAYPVVECEFNPKLNLVEFLFAPANINASIEEKAKQLAIDVIQKLDMVGILAVEMFLSKNGQITINEIAPRPHNSGHHTIECNYTSQFEQHLRAILNLPLGSTEIILPGVMINLIGEEAHSGKVKYTGIKDALTNQGVFVHLYGKTETKPHRKMGHVTIVNSNLNEAKSTARELLEKIKVIS